MIRLCNGCLVKKEVLAMMKMNVMHHSDYCNVLKNDSLICLSLGFLKHDNLYDRVGECLTSLLNHVTYNMMLG